ncbi:MAG: hypothetical protein K5678_01395 [Acetatifactor sp.]|nr:hypothetical protein [Acetatifactor sp.]
MRPSLTYEQYRGIDLCFFAAISFFAELVIALAASRWFPDQLYTVSATAGITAIVFMRWRGYGLIPAILGAIAFCIAMGANWQQLLVYCIGNAFAAGALLMLKLAGEKKIRTNAIWTICFGMVTLLLMHTGRAVLSILLGAGLHQAAAFYATDSLSYVFTAVILWIAARQDGMFENQKDYLRRLHESLEAEKEELS